MSTNVDAAIQAQVCLRAIVWLLEQVSSLGFTELDGVHHRACEWLAHFDSLVDENRRSR